MEWFWDLFLFITLSNGLAQPNSDQNVTGLVDHMQKLEGLFSSLQSQSQVQEHKYSAVLSSVLSKLAVTTDDLAQVKKQNHETLTELDKVKAQLATVKADLKSSQIKLNQSLQNTDSLVSLVTRLSSIQTQLMSNVTDTAMEVYNVKRNASHLNEAISSNTDILTELRMNMSSVKQEVGFEARLSYGTNGVTQFRKGEVLRFDTLYNGGNGYNNATGYFTPPVSGTYSFWLHIVVSQATNPIVIFVKTKTTHLGIGYQRMTPPFSPVTTSTLAYLAKGETVWLTANGNITVPGFYSSFGGALLRAY